MPQKKTPDYRAIVGSYQAETKATVVELRVVIPWAIQRGLLADPPDPVRYHIDRASAALQHSRRTAGGPRDWHSVTEKVDTTEGELVQRTMWAHLDDAPTAFLQTSIEQRVEQNEADRRAILRDIEAIAEKHPALGKRLRQRVLYFKEGGSAA